MSQGKINYDPKTFSEMVSNLEILLEKINTAAVSSESALELIHAQHYKGSNLVNLTQSMEHYNALIKNLQAAYYTAIHYVNFSEESMKKDDERIQQIIDAKEAAETYSY